MRKTRICESVVHISCFSGRGDDTYCVMHFHCPDQRHGTAEVGSAVLDDHEFGKRSLASTLMIGEIGWIGGVQK